VRQTLRKSAFQTPANWNSPHGKKLENKWNENWKWSKCDKKFGTKFFFADHTIK
jgi:hypothetical protein